MSEDSGDSCDQRADTQGLNPPLWCGLLVLGLFMAVLAIIAVVSFGRCFGKRCDLDPETDGAPFDSIEPPR